MTSIVQRHNVHCSMLSSHTTFRPHADSAHVHAHVHNALQHCYANEQLRKPTFCITARSSANGHVTTASLKRFNATENSKTQTVFQHCYDEQLRGGGMRGEAGAALLRYVRRWTWQRPRLVTWSRQSLHAEKGSSFCDVTCMTTTNSNTSADAAYTCMYVHDTQLFHCNTYQASKYLALILH